MLELRNISYLVDDENGRNEIINDVSLDIREKFVAITGPNGSGKSTLAKLIAGILKPTSGRIILDGTDITDLNIDERARLGISFAFQQPIKFKGITVRDIISLASGKKLPLNVVCDYLSQVGLCARDYVDREINDSLSGGELKRIEIATIMARGTKLSIFDEPEAGIDLWSFQNLIQVFNSLREKTDGSIIVISHQERILNIADKVILLADGKVGSYAEAGEIIPSLANGVTDVCSKIPGQGEQTIG